MEYGKMKDPELKAKWLGGLRSDKYTQAPNALRTEEGHCCLGVLCDIIDPKNWGDVSSDTGATAYKYDGIDDNEDSTQLPWRVAQALGIQNVQSVLMEMNDGVGDEHRTFAQIADFIEENL